MPGETGYEALTLKMAQKWGADVIRDSDGTALSDEIVNAGYGIYSTVCIVRDHNEWARKNLDKLQQSFLMTQPKVAVKETVTFALMDDFFQEQFAVNDSPESMKYWQVFDRTLNQEVPSSQWKYDFETGSVTIKNSILWHKYTVNFLAYRIWEEISMYNHTTNNWDSEHLMQIDPYHIETQKYMLDWMDKWCKDHPDTDVVRFTSMFYNFVWIWGSSERKRNHFTDWASYDFTVSPIALDEFALEYGYQLRAEDFINKGDFNVTHMPANDRKRDWMEFVNKFVVGFGKQLIDLVHKYNKRAYVFYDDNWVGIEPYHERFKEFGFDGIIKSVFSGYEARLAAGVDVDTHELRLHPYLFPVGLRGEAQFIPGGNPTLQAKEYWNSIRRALLRQPVDRLGLGGYLHLVEPYPKFCDYIEKLLNEFREIKGFHKEGAPLSFRPKVAVLHYWGKLRSWTLSGHFHESFMHDLIHINESLSGLPLDVEFISFEDIKNGIPEDFDVIINAGIAGSAWSGGDAWRDERIVESLTKWVYEGGTFLGVNEPSAVTGYDTYFRMSHVLGIDQDIGPKVNHGKWMFDLTDIPGLFPEESKIKGKENLYLTDGNATVLLEDEGLPVMTMNDFGKGKGVYLASYEVSLANTRMLLNTILYAAGEKLEQKYLTDNANTECAYYPDSNKLVVINNSENEQTTSIMTEKGSLKIRLDAYDTKIEDLS